jgi:hypothetical protein
MQGTEGIYMKILFILFLLISLTACQKDVPLTVDPPLSYTIQQYVDALATGMSNTSAALSAEAVKVSGVYDALSEANYPLFLILFDKEGSLESYLAENGLTREGFLTHPKLSEFVRSHLIYGQVNIDSSNIGSNARFQSDAGSEITIEVVRDSEGGKVKGGTANGVALQLFCPVSTTDVESETSQICFADGPILQNFDWSQ